MWFLIKLPSLGATFWEQMQGTELEKYEPGMTSGFRSYQAECGKNEGNQAGELNQAPESYMSAPASS